MHLLLVAVLGAAVVGFFVGIDYGVPRPDIAGPFESGSAGTSHVAPATAYLDMQRVDLGPNQTWRSDLAKLPRTEINLFEVFVPDLEEKVASLAARSERRAYNGAPPVVPHEIDQRSSANCLACHQESLRIGAATSGLMPHPYLASCQQCHVRADGPLFGLAINVASNSFDGLAAPLSGEHAWPGAPPTMPHSTLMRENCLACHGPTGKPGLRTTHPSRQSCQQCHAPSAELDQGILASRATWQWHQGSTTP